MNKSECTILIPALNEESTIANTIQDFQAHGFNNILVIDGHSTDNTGGIATRNGALVLQQPNKGKGDAVVYGIMHIHTPYIIMVDADYTYPAYYGEFMLTAMQDKNIDHCIGNRLIEYDKGAFKPLNLFGNKFFSWLFKLKYKKDMVDILSGYRGFKTNTMSDLKSQGFEVETEMCKLVARKNLKFVVIPTRYRARPDKKDTKLHPFKDGWKILKSILKR